MWGVYKGLRFRRKFWKGDTILELFLCRWPNHLGMITQRMTINRRKFMVAHNPRLPFEMHISKKEKIYQGRLGRTEKKISSRYGKI